MAWGWSPVIRSLFPVLCLEHPLSKYRSSLAETLRGGNLRSVICEVFLKKVDELMVLVLNIPMWGVVVWWSRFCKCRVNKGILGTIMKVWWVAMFDEAMVDGVICPAAVCADTNEVLILATTCVICMMAPSSRKWLLRSANTPKIVLNLRN